MNWPHDLPLELKAWFENENARALEEAKDLLSRLKPFDEWRRETCPDERAIESYWIVAFGLAEIIETGQALEVFYVH